MSDYKKRMKDPNWKIGKKKDLAAFAKGAGGLAPGEKSDWEKMKESASAMADKASKALEAMMEEKKDKK